MNIPNFDAFINRLNKDGFLDDDSTKEVKDEIQLLLEKKIIEKGSRFYQLSHEMEENGIKLTTEDIDQLRNDLFSRFLGPDFAYK